ncbi:MoaD/ThiS family protein [Novosphingobium sp.]|uniref:MoaD/ThiS family protein n=1 Tax=Novosphingobium sp. TaxID=1874826 RepID=UPI001EB9F644|nr:MoaD/ThiS family protein [Novosphingobium sp.]MBK6800754.1 MoaD/ThiS family protein [Novosphingobium sp.]MBK9011313.1 MoaD/ThiS family protein [Novosphingobium sp.]
MAKLVFLGRLEDLAGGPEREVAPGPLEAVLATLPVELAVALLGDRVRIARNGELITERGGIVLAEGDEIAFLPPVSGG